MTDQHLGWPAGVAETLESATHHAMTLAFAVITCPGNPKMMAAYRRQLDRIVSRFVPTLTRADVAADVGRFLIANTADDNLYRCATRCAGRLATRHRFPTKENPR